MFLIIHGCFNLVYIILFLSFNHFLKIKLLCCVAFNASMCVLETKWYLKRVLFLANRLKVSIAKMQMSEFVDIKMKIKDQPYQELIETFNKTNHLLRNKQVFYRSQYKNLIHEIRGVLTTLVCRLEAIEDGIIKSDDVEIKRQLEELLYIGQILNDYDELITYKHEHIHLKKTQVNLGRYLMGIQEYFSLYANHHQIELTYKNLCETPVVALIDCKRMKQVFNNLIRNAVRHSQQGSHIQLRMEKVLNDKCIVSLIDEGEGISMNHLTRIFNRGYQYKGEQGIGLSIVYELIHLHGGEVWVESQQGKGSVFYLSIPIISGGKAIEYETVS